MKKLLRLTITCIISITMLFCVSSSCFAQTVTADKNIDDFIDSIDSIIDEGLDSFPDDFFSQEEIDEILSDVEKIYGEDYTEEDVFNYLLTSPKYRDKILSLTNEGLAIVMKSFNAYFVAELVLSGIIAIGGIIWIVVSKNKRNNEEFQPYQQ